MAGRAGRTEPPPRELAAWRMDTDESSVAILSYPAARPELERLTAAERAVVQRALAGASNAEIARARRTSVRTIANQLSSAYRRLGVKSRRELAARLAASG
jgi:DNA-binding CsgD family transcriptional regulator